MRSSLVQILLLRFFKTFHKYLANANFELFHFNSVIFFGQKEQKNCTNEISIALTAKSVQKQQKWFFILLEIYNFYSGFSFSINNSCETVCIIGRKINVLSTTSQFYTVCWIDGTRAAQHLLVKFIYTEKAKNFCEIFTYIGQK